MIVYALGKEAVTLTDDILMCSTGGNHVRNQHKLGFLPTFERIVLNLRQVKEHVVRMAERRHSLPPKGYHVRHNSIAAGNENYNRLNVPAPPQQELSPSRLLVGQRAHISEVLKRLTVDDNGASS